MLQNEWIAYSTFSNSNILIPKMSKDLIEGVPSQGSPKMVSSSSNGVDMPLVRRKDGGTNYLKWRNHTVQRLAELYPSIYKEFSEAALVETEAEAWARLEPEFPQVPLQNDMTNVVPADVFDQWADNPNAARRTQAFMIAIEEVREARRIQNQAAIAANKVATASITALVAEVTKKKDLRVSMANLLLGPKFISHDCLVTIQADGRFLLGQENSAFTIHAIVMDKLQQMPGPRREQQLKAQIGIRTMKQGSTRLDIFITMFKEQRVLCEDLGLVLGEEELRSIFIGALNPFRHRCTFSPVKPGIKVLRAFPGE